MPNHNTPETPGSIIKHFKVRIEFKNPHTFHAIEAWLQADNIISASELVMTYFGALGVDPGDVKQLIEIDPR
jgi:hypothetical protein